MRPLVAVTIVAVLGTCYAARLENTYLPPGSAGSAGGAGLIQAPNRGGAGGPLKIAGPTGAGPFGGGPAGNNNQYVPPSGAGGHGGVGGGPGAFGLGGSGGAGGAGGLRGGGGGGAGPGQDIPIVSYSNENSGDGNYQFSYETGNGISAQETGHLQGETEAVSGSYSYTGPDGVQYSISYTADEEGFHPQGAHLPTPPPIPPEIQRGVELALAAEARGENQGGSSGGGGAGYPQGGPSAFPGAGRGGAGGRGSGGSPVYQGPNSYQASSGGGYRY